MRQFVERKRVTSLVLAAIALACVVAIVSTGVAPAASGGGTSLEPPTESLTVPAGPGTVTSTSFFHPDLSYRMVITGTITLTQSDGSTFTCDAFYCNDFPSPGHQGISPLKVHNTNPDFGPLYTYDANSTIPPYSPDHRYEISVSGFTGHLQLRSDFGHSGSCSQKACDGAWTVDIYDTTALNCKVGSPGSLHKPGQLTLAWSYLIAGAPKPPRPANLIGTASAGRGQVTFATKLRNGQAERGRSNGRACVFEERAVGNDYHLTLSIVSINHATLPIFDKLERYLTLPWKVVASDDPTCPIGSHGTLFLVERYRARSGDSVFFSGPDTACGLYEFNDSESEARVVVSIKKTKQHA